MSVELVGRDAELGLLGTFLDSRTAAAAALVLEGEAGIGKSTLWSAGLAAARERGLCVLSARPAEAEQGLACAGLGDLFEGELDGILSELQPRWRRPLEIALLLEEPAQDVDPRAVAVAVRSALELLAYRGVCNGTLGLVEHWSGDPESAVQHFAVAEEAFGATEMIEPALKTWRADYAEALLEAVGERSVASHLSRVYTKLGVRSRTEPARRLTPSP
jgi:AAA ATPase domain